MKNRILKKVGAPSIEELKSSPGFPNEEDLPKGLIAIIECVEEIPCNPCETSCPKGAIIVGKPITNLPSIDLDKCIGCGKCVSACPGLAIYLKDFTYNENDALITFPFEFLPLPKVNDRVMLVNRRGIEVCEGKVVKVNCTKANDYTVLLSVVFPKKYFHDVVSIRRL